ncbi:MAG TPA: hypothetical protein VGJ05_18805 [Fimbriiglobus sp.]|jgi:hypothetical protein
MTATRFRTGLAAAWLCLGVCLLLRGILFPADVFAKYDATRLTLGGWFAVALAAWNGMRVYWMKSVGRAPTPNPLRQTRAGNGNREYNPAFDFTTHPDQEMGGKPSTSTD